MAQKWQTYMIVSAITHDDLFTEVLEWEGGKPKDMCEVLDRVMEKGRQKGRQEGVDATRLENIKNIMEVALNRHQGGIRS